MFAAPVTTALRRAVGAIACVVVSILPLQARAQDSLSLARLKIAPDLLTTVGSSALPDAPWARLLGGELLVRALVVSNSDDPSLTALRRQIVSMGGSVTYNYLSIRALAVMVPASRLLELAQSPEVASISPNRAVTRTASVLQATTGAGEAVGPGGSRLDGSGVGIAVLDSGIAAQHQSVSKSFLGLKGASRVKRSLDIVALSKGLTDLSWVAGSDRSAENLVSLAGLSLIQQPRLLLPDPYGHGTHVASIAAGSASYQWPDSSGVAPNADLYDIRVLDNNGVGNIADVIAGIDWVIQNAKALNIRVMNLSLAANSTESFRTDPLARAARAAVASGVVVVVAAGNFGKLADGREVYGAVGSPGHDPSVITVGAANLHGTVQREDDTVTTFSSRGPTRGRGTLDGKPWIDNLLKPDLVAPGNRIVGALSSDVLGTRGSWNRLVSSYPQLAAVPGAAQAPNQTLMELSGTSVAAPVVSGTVALMLQANPGLTPPLVKAILQYTAQPLPRSNLLQQGTGLLNVEGAARLASALRSDIGPALAAGTLRAGDPLLARGKTMPVPQSTLNGRRFYWGKLVVAGGNHLLSGDALFTKFQPIYDPTLTWTRQLALKSAVRYWPYTKIPRAIDEARLTGHQRLVTGGVLWVNTAVSRSAPSNGLFIATPTLSGYAANGSAFVLSEGFVLSEAFVLSEHVTDPASHADPTPPGER